MSFEDDAGECGCYSACRQAARRQYAFRIDVSEVPAPPTARRTPLMTAKLPSGVTARSESRGYVVAYSPLGGENTWEQE